MCSVLLAMGLLLEKMFAVLTHPQPFSRELAPALEVTFDVLEVFFDVFAHRSKMSLVIPSPASSIRDECQQDGNHLQALVGESPAFVEYYPLSHFPSSRVFPSKEWLVWESQAQAPVQTMFRPSAQRTVVKERRHAEATFAGLAQDYKRFQIAFACNLAERLYLVVLLVSGRQRNRAWMVAMEDTS
jgi:hypothetical protein